jgi:hypothetical protein
MHIIQLKLLTAIRIGKTQKKIDIDIPKLDDFIHKVYINIARKVYKNVYLFELGVPPLVTQRNGRELEIIVQESILNAVRDSIPVETILRAYMDETEEDEVTEEVVEVATSTQEPTKSAETKVISEIDQPVPPSHDNESVPSTPIVNTLPMNSPQTEPQSIITTTKPTIAFSDVDSVLTNDDVKTYIDAPKMIVDSPNRDNTSPVHDDGLLVISDESMQAPDMIDICDINMTPDKTSSPTNELLLDDIEVLH